MSRLFRTQPTGNRRNDRPHAVLERVRGGDARAAESLVESLYPLVIRIVRSHLPRRATEEDLAQEVFLKLFTRLDRYRERGGIPLEHWGIRLAVRDLPGHPPRGAAPAGDSLVGPGAPRARLGCSMCCWPATRRPRARRWRPARPWKRYCGNCLPRTGW